MQNQRRHQQVEQIEIIERTVEECSRFNLTHERDAERDPSVLYSPSGLSQPSRFVSPPIFHSTPERSTSINQFGYDLHEVQARDNERVMETHGTGKLLHEESMFDRTGVDGALRSSPIGILKHNQLGLTVGEVEGQSRISPFSDSIQRKDSYRRMQELPHDVSCGEPSNLSAISGRLKHLAEWTGKFFEFGRFKQQKRLSADGSLDKLKGSLTEISRQMGEGEWTPRLVSILIFAFIFLSILLLLFWFIFSSLFLPRSTFSFWLYPPLCEECQRRTGSSYRSPSKLYVHLHSPAQLHFELVGSPPFKSNSFTAVDFDTGYVAVADHSLTDSVGSHTVCFIMQLDTSALPDRSLVNDALKKTFQEVYAQFGWQEYWQFTVERVDTSFVQGKFKDPIEDCHNVQWYFLKHTLYTNDESCSYCYDFCLPDYAVLRRQKYEDEMGIGIRRLNCFRLYIPEWSKYQYKTDATGGHFVYPINLPQNTQRDENGNWVNWKHSTKQQSVTATK